MAALPATVLAVFTGGSVRITEGNIVITVVKMNDYNAGVVRRVLTAIAGLEAGTIALGDAQSALQIAIPLFENDGSGVGDAVDSAEADLELIQFTTLLEEQRPAAILRLSELRTAIERATDG